MPLSVNIQNAVNMQVDIFNGKVRNISQRQKKTYLLCVFCKYRKKTVQELYHNGWLKTFQINPLNAE
jgi:ribosomal protein S8